MVRFSMYPVLRLLYVLTMGARQLEGLIISGISWKSIANSNRSPVIPKRMKRPFR